MKMMNWLVAALATGIAATAAAETNPLSVQATVDGWSLSFETSVLPKGWFSTGNQFDRTKTTLVADITALEVACSADQQSDARLSTSDGAVLLSEHKNAAGNNVIGYSWKYTGWDLTNLRNSYSLYYRCDGSVEVRGCDTPRPIELTLTALDKNGRPRAFEDDTGAQQPVTFTVSGLELAAYHDAAADDTESCEPDCGIGPCQSECVQACPTGQAGKSCREACVCECKIENWRATEGACHANDKCVEGLEP